MLTPFRSQHHANNLRLSKRRYLTLRLFLYPGRILLLSRQRRHILKWIISTTPQYLLRKPSPWITFDAIDYLEKHATPDWKVFEYGSGGSTLYWLSKGAECVSIEHDPSWYKKLLSLFPNEARIDYRLVPPTLSEDDSVAGGWEDPESYRSSWDEFKGHSFRAYVSQIDGFPEEYFDVVLVDGRARPSCIRHALPKVKPGGMLVVDNGERPHYYPRTGRDLAENFRLLSFRGICPAMPYRSQTDVFVKNGGS